MRAKQLILTIIVIITISAIRFPLEFRNNSNNSHTIVHATEENSHSEGTPSEGTHSEAASNHDSAGENLPHKEEGKFTFFYIIYWAGLIVLLALAGRYVLIAKEVGLSAVEPVHEDKESSFILKMVGLALFIYAIDQLPAMRHYHEPAAIGAVRFLLKFLAGIGMMIYSFSGFGHEDSHH